MKTVLYARSSIISQLHSIDMQKALALEKVKSTGILFDDLYLDEAISARKSEIHERPELNRLVKDIEKGQISTLYVYKRDRLARNVVQYMELFELIRSKQITIVFTADNEIPIQFSPAGEFFELMMAGFNQREANQIIQRIKETKYTMTKQGKHAQGRIPYGYNLDSDKRYQLEPSQAVTVRKLFDALIETECNTLSNFTRDMQQQTWFPDRWDYNRIQTLIGNSIYKGIRRIEEFGEYVEIVNENLIIISESTWNLAQDKIKSLKQTRTRNSSRSPMMLDGLLVCGKCSTHMYGKEKSDLLIGKFYTCKKHNYLQFSPELLENSILEECARFVTQQFQTYFAEVYHLTHGNMIQFYKNSIAESQKELQGYKQHLQEETAIWINTPSPDLQVKLIYLLNCIHREELLQQHYPVELNNLQLKFQQMMELQNSIDLITEILLYDHSEQKKLIHDLAQRIIINFPSLIIEFKHPFIGKAVIEDFNAI